MELSIKLKLRSIVSLNKTKFGHRPRRVKSARKALDVPTCDAREDVRPGVVQVSLNEVRGGRWIA